MKSKVTHLLKLPKAGSGTQHMFSFFFEQKNKNVLLEIWQKLCNKRKIKAYTSSIPPLKYQEVECPTSGHFSFTKINCLHMLSSQQMFSVCLFVCFPFLHNIICDLKQGHSPISQPVSLYRKQGVQTKWPFPHLECHSYQIKHLLSDHQIP